MHGQASAPRASRASPRAIDGPLSGVSASGECVCPWRVDGWMDRVQPIHISGAEATSNDASSVLVSVRGGTVIIPAMCVH